MHAAAARVRRRPCTACAWSAWPRRRVRAESGGDD
eukprot:CAMPEP_0203924304 /NCGR_PEP_ID=MMETSP0359-20131031/64071_1 /ASSEMBLY_ACC=CAM_ASM_000338 /TAXON_ID=268821 /ORGANISM="Scrippsiella Hangoei, Strain SHTV-5" /LENGTH=34 /DNA_ID= /DNA_START= /DNA_END= /DNA_ORIENTATION=